MPSTLRVVRVRNLFGEPPIPWAISWRLRPSAQSGQVHALHLRETATATSTFPLTAVCSPQYAISPPVLGKARPPCQRRVFSCLYRPPDPGRKIAITAASVAPAVASWVATCSVMPNSIDSVAIAAHVDGSLSLLTENFIYSPFDRLICFWRQGRQPVEPCFAFRVRQGRRTDWATRFSVAS